MSNPNAFYVESPSSRQHQQGLVELLPVAIGITETPIFQSDCGIAIGKYAGLWAQGECAIAIGEYAGSTYQGMDAVALGSEAGAYHQLKEAIAVGSMAGQFTQGTYTVAIGSEAGQNSQNQCSIAIGKQAGQYEQSTNAIAIGSQAGQYTQGEHAVAIGNRAGRDIQHPNSIILNATGNILNSQTSNALYVAPIRSEHTNPIGLMTLVYDSAAQEIKYTSVASPEIAQLQEDILDLRAGVENLVEAINVIGQTINVLQEVDLTELRLAIKFIREVDLVQLRAWFNTLTGEE